MHLCHVQRTCSHAAGAACLGLALGLFHLLKPEFTVEGDVVEKITVVPSQGSPKTGPPGFYQQIGGKMESSRESDSRPEPRTSKVVSVRAQCVLLQGVAAFITRH